MVIQPSELTRIILFVSPAAPSSLEDPDYEKTIAFKSLSHIANNRDPNRAYYYWLIYSKESKETAELIDSHFAGIFETKNRERLYLISDEQKTEEIFQLIHRIASVSYNRHQTLYCDCTAGTKTISIAMALACHHINLTGDHGTTLILTFISAKDVPKNLSFHHVDLSPFIIKEQERYIQLQNRLGKMAYLASVSPILAHEIKNPLNLIKADLYLLRSEESSSAKPLLREMEATVDQISRTIDTVQQVVRGQSKASVVPAIPLSQVIHRLKLRTEGRFPALNLQIKGELTLIKLRISEEKLYTIFTNLIDNAANATYGRGTVILGFSVGIRKIRVEVCDDGPGIPPKLRATLFKPMYRRNNGAGTGMGLHIVKTFISEEGGNIRYDDSYQGARFLIELPLDSSEVIDYGENTISR